MNRDDLPDGGAAHFAQTVFWVKNLNPGIRVELLIPDFEVDLSALKTVVDSGIDILNHNIETVPRLYGKVRPGHTYECSRNILKTAKSMRPQVLTKTGLMLGVGETREEVMTTLEDLRSDDVDIVTLGQYLQPSPRQLKVDRYLDPTEFVDFKLAGEKLGLLQQSVKGDLSLFHQSQIPEKDSSRVDRCLNPMPCNGLEGRWVQEAQTLFLGLSHNGLTQWML